MKSYIPPTPADLRRLKDDLGMDGQQMAELFCLAGKQQWRKYTGGESPREMSLPLLFLAAARLSLPPEAIETVLQRMRDVGAEVDIAMESPETDQA